MRSRQYKRNEQTQAIVQLGEKVNKLSDLGEKFDKLAEVVLQQTQAGGEMAVEQEAPTGEVAPMLPTENQTQGQSGTPNVVTSFLKYIFSHSPKVWQAIDDTVS
eukprot:GHVS01056667.1.p4 GENE.GHVS01056667.1~~GHVS01056667.1.p4  ORF type:complete len:104 (-),score=15.84 GHVS01056667.1:1086-1397(-)